MMRLQRLLAVAASVPARGRGLAALAHDVGYADQARMYRDVRRKTTARTITQMMPQNARVRLGCATVENILS